MPLRILIVSDPFGKPSFAPRLRYLCNYLVEKGHYIEVYTEFFQPIEFSHSYPIIEQPIAYQNQWQWAWQSLWSLLTDWRNRHFSKWLKQQVKEKHFDIVFCTTFSTFPLRAAHEIAQEKQLPLFVDIRDLDEQVPGAQYQSHRQWWAKLFRTWYQKINIQRRNRVLRQADCISTISPWHRNFIQAFNCNTHLIYNGFDPKQFYSEDIPNDKFLISYIGKIYEFQSLSLIEQAISNLQLPDLELNIHTPDHHPLSIDKVGDEIRKSSIMLVLTNPAAKGMMTTKFFEALGCEKPVLCIPSDEGLLAQTIIETNAGLASSQLTDIQTFIVEKYQEWKQKSYTRQMVKNKDQFSRFHQAQKFEKLLIDYSQKHKCPQ